MIKLDLFSIELHFNQWISFPWPLDIFIQGVLTVWNQSNISLVRIFKNKVKCKSFKVSKGASDGGHAMTTDY